MKYIYDAQIRRILLQITRIFTQFSVKYSVAEDGTVTYRRVPAKFAGTDTLVQSIITNNSENFLLSIPFIAISITNIDYDRKRVGTTGVYKKDKFSTREWDEEKQTYTHKEGDRYEIDRYQGFPINIEIEANIFTTNLTQKLELFEQICLIFNPSMDFQTSNAPLDMYRLNTLELTRIKFSDRSFPFNPAEQSFDTMTLTFNAQCYVSPPAKLDVQRTIETIVTNIGNNIDNPEAYDITPMNRFESTPGNYSFEISDQVLADGTYTGKSLIKIIGDITWEKLLKPYGIYESGVSQFRLRCLDWNRDNQFNQDGTKKKDYEIIGTIQVPSIDNESEMVYEPNVAIWTIDMDSLPEISLGTIDGIIDPLVQIPQKKEIVNWLNRDEKIQTIDMVNGIKYLVLEDVKSNTKAWGVFYNTQGERINGIHSGDIIQYRDLGSVGRWIQVFDSTKSVKPEYVYSNYDRRVYYFADGNWSDLINGKWSGSRVRLICKPFEDEYYN